MQNIVYLFYKDYHCSNYSSNKSTKNINVNLYLIETFTLKKNRQINVHTNINPTIPIIYALVFLRKKYNNINVPIYPLLPLVRTCILKKGLHAYRTSTRRNSRKSRATLSFLRINYRSLMK